MSDEMDGGKFIDEEEDWTQRRVQAPRKVRVVIEGPASESYVLGALAGLLLGGATEGSDQFFRRLKQWQARTDSRASEIDAESPDENDEDRLRYAAIGLLSKASDMAQGAFSTAVQASDSAYSRVSDWLSPLTNSRLMQPVRQRYNTWAAHGMTIAEQWIDAGRTVERRSRALARQAAADGTDEAMDEVIGIMAQKPEVRELVTQQGAGMAQDVVNVVRQRSAVADDRWEHRVRSLLRRH